MKKILVGQYIKEDFREGTKISYRRITESQKTKWNESKINWFCAYGDEFNFTTENGFDFGLCFMNFCDYDFETKIYTIKNINNKTFEVKIIQKRS